jgi:hypothetical protein
MGDDEFLTHLYFTGDATPGVNVAVKFIGLPCTMPIALCIGAGVHDLLLNSIWGDWHLKFPIFGPIGLPQIPTPGVLMVPGTIPGTTPPPYSIPMQALIGDSLSNLCVLDIN